MKRSQGITLVELLVVVSILAILLSVSVSFYSNNVKKSKMTSYIHSNSTDKIKIKEYYAIHNTFGTKDEFNKSSFAVNFNSEAHDGKSKRIIWKSADSVEVFYIIE